MNMAELYTGNSDKQIIILNYVFLGWKPILEETAFLFLLKKNIILVRY